MLTVTSFYKLRGPTMTYTPDSGLFASPLHIINVGADLVADALTSQGVPVDRVAWKPAAGNSDTALSVLLDYPRVDHANQEAVQRMLAARPRLVDVRPAGEVIPGMPKHLLLPAGPPITWERMSGPLRGAIIGALIYEGLAPDLAAAEQLAASGAIAFEPCHHHNAVGPMAGLISASMPVQVLEEPVYGHQTYSTLNEGLGKVLRYGANSPDVIAKLRWLEQGLGPALARAVRAMGGIEIKTITAQSLKVVYVSGSTEEAANPDIGDSTISETAGIGAFAMATAPAIVQFIGGTPADALRYTLEMYDITVAEDSQYQLPPLNFRGTPVGIDIRQVVRQNLLPIINTGIAHRLPGIGQAGAGIVRPPM